MLILSNMLFVIIDADKGSKHFNRYLTNVGYNFNVYISHALKKHPKLTIHPLYLEIVFFLVTLNLQKNNLIYFLEIHFVIRHIK